MDHRAASLIQSTPGPGAGMLAGIRSDGSLFLADLNRSLEPLLEAATDIDYGTPVSLALTLEPNGLDVYEVVLGNCPKILPALLGHNVQADLNLPEVIDRPIRYGNLTVRPADKPVKTVVWGVYCTGPKTEVTLRGPVRICELMVWDGRVRLVGGQGTYNACCACTTLDVHGKAQVELENARLGRPLEWAKGNLLEARSLKISD